MIGALGPKDGQTGLKIGQLDKNDQPCKKNSRLGQTVCQPDKKDSHPGQKNVNQIRQSLCLKGLSTIPEEWSQIQLYSQIGKAEGQPGQKFDQAG